MKSEFQNTWCLDGSQKAFHYTAFSNNKYNLNLMLSDEIFRESESEQGTNYYWQDE